MPSTAERQSRGRVARPSAAQQPPSPPPNPRKKQQQRSAAAAAADTAAAQQRTKRRRAEGGGDGGGGITEEDPPPPPVLASLTPSPSPTPSSSPGAVSGSPPPPPPPPLSAFLASHASATSAASYGAPLPLCFPPFSRPFTSASRGLYEGSLPWPLPAPARQASATAEEEDAEDGEEEEEEEDMAGPSASHPASSLSFSQLSALSTAPFPPSASASRPPPFIPPQLDLPYRLSSATFLPSTLHSLTHPPLQEQPAGSPDVLLSPSAAASRSAAAPRGGGMLLLLRLAQSQPSDSSPSASTLSPLLLLLRPTGPLQDQLSLLAQPWPPPSSSSPREAAAAVAFSQLDGALLQLTCTHPDASLPCTIFPTPSSLPLVISHTAARAYVHRIERVGSSWSLVCVDTFAPYTPPLLCLAANCGLCSSTYCEVACVDAGGCIYTWAMQLSPAAEAAAAVDHSGGGAGGADTAQPVRALRAVASLSGERRRVSATLRSFYEEPLQLLQRPLLTFARCAFAPHPRSLLLLLDARLLRVDLAAIAVLAGSPTEDAQLDAVLARPLPLPPLSAVSLPVNRHRADPVRPQALRDHFFRYQRYKHTPHSAVHPEPAATVDDELEEQQEEEEEAESEADGDFTASLRGRSGRRLKAEGAASPGEADGLEQLLGDSDGRGGGQGRVCAMCWVSEWPHLLAVLSSAFLLLVDVRHSAQPLLEWQMPQPLLQPSHLTCIALAGEGSHRSLLLAVWQEGSEQVDVYHCGLTLTSALAAVSSFAPLRLPSFPHAQLSKPSSFRLLHPPRTALTGLAFTVDSDAVSASSPPPRLAPSPHAPASACEEPISMSALPTFRLFLLSSTGAILAQAWTAAEPSSSAADSAEADAAGESDGWIGRPPPVASTAQQPRPLLQSPSPSSASPLWPSDTTPPAWLTRSSVRPSDRIDLTLLFYSPSPQRTHHTAPAALVARRTHSRLLALADAPSLLCRATQASSRSCRSPPFPVSSPAPALTTPASCGGSASDALPLLLFSASLPLLHRRGQSASNGRPSGCSCGCVGCARGGAQRGAASLLHCAAQRIRHRTARAELRVDAAAAAGGRGRGGAA